MAEEQNKTEQNRTVFWTQDACLSATLLRSAVSVGGSISDQTVGCKQKVASTIITPALYSLM